MNQTTIDAGRFDVAKIAAILPETATTLLVDHYLTNRQAASARVFRVYKPTPPHYHTTCDEYLYVFSGRGTFWFEDESTSAEFGPGELLFFKRGTVHALPKILADPVVFLSIDTPRRDPKDIVFVNPEDGTPESFIKADQSHLLGGSLKSMKARTILAVAAAAITLTSSALGVGDKYSDLVAKGYRWTTADGLYAYVSKDDVGRMVNNPGNEVKAYFLIPGTIVQVTEEDPISGLSKIRMAGITVDLWTPTRFPSKHAVQDTYGVIETPETSGLIPTGTSAIDTGPTPVPDFSPIPDMSPAPSASPTPTPETNQ